MTAAYEMIHSVVPTKTRWYVVYGKANTEDYGLDEGSLILLSGFTDETVTRAFVRKALKQGFTICEVGTLEDVEPTIAESGSIQNGAKTVNRFVFVERPLPPSRRFI